MSFGQEVKDFAAGFKMTSSAINDARRTQAYEDQVANMGEKGNGWDFGSSADPVTGKYWDGADKPIKKKRRRSPIQNVGRWLGMSGGGDDESSSVPTLPGQIVSPVVDRDTSSFGEGYDEDLGYSRGGAVRPVRRYALGGPVLPDDEEDTTFERPATPPPVVAPRQALPVQAPTQEAAPPAPPAQEPDDALHAGIMTIQKQFGLDRPKPAVGEDYERIAGQKAMMNSIGRPSDQDMDDAAKAVGVDRHLDKAKSNLRIMEQGYKWYLGHGEVDKANNFAASIIQYATYEAGKFGAAALDDLRRGDIKSAVENAAQGYDSLPNGYNVTPKVNEDGTISVSKVNSKTGESSGEHTITPQQLYQAALSLTNKSGSWEALTSAAAERRGQPKPPAQLSPVDVDAIAGVSGVDSDGAPVQNRPTMPGQTPDNAPAGPSITEVGDQPTQLAGGADEAIQQMPEYQREYATMMARKESSNDPNAINKSGHAGLFQFDVDTWKTATGQTIDKKVIGTKDDPRLNPALAAKAMRTLTAKNEGAFRKKFGRDPSPADLAVMHQQGTTGGLRLLSADPNDPAKRYLRAAALTQNGVPATATAGQAVQAIKQYYFGGKGGAKSSDPLDVLPALDEDRGEGAPELATIPQPKWVRPDATKLAGMTTEGRKIYIQQIRERNLEMGKEYTAAQSENQKKFSADSAAHTAALKAARADATKPIPTKDRIDVIDKLNAAEEKDEVKTMFGAEGEGEKVAGKPELKDVRPIAYELFSRNDVPDTTAYQLAAQLVDPTTKNFKLHETPNGTYRLVTSQGKFTLTPNGRAQIAAIRGRLRSEAAKAGEVPKANWGETAKKGGKALVATAGIGGNVLGTADKAVGALLTPGTPERLLKGTKRTIGKLADEAFLNKANRR